MRSITTVLLFLALAALGLCRPIPDTCPIANCESVMEAIGNLKGEIKDDPQGVTQQWKGSGEGNGNKNKNKTEEGKSDDGTEVTENTENTENTESTENTENTENTESTATEGQTDDPTEDPNGTGGNTTTETESTATEGQTDDQTPDDGGMADCQNHPGAHGKYHSSGTHSTPNCPPPS
ncbi:uncharacterized protein SEPMUDRAFT_151397 [Sphaerulina musiva SO2202]|uniref:Uncharacterized protein n=1 Tax=Sphaerulina musiva (strain SO2202) TaxID=692275 RepID=N1QDC3_SPHMS|nr:uncharacterized protein SEPMUDRAFT_151397 [Sphaerulina musiva SO2202]EMF09330.1 hypothetical protein SEPMUDRAFT_151397 [Sphaerulina musiva SO2202]